MTLKEAAGLANMPGFFLRAAAMNQGSKDLMLDRIVRNDAKPVCTIRKTTGESLSPLTKYDVFALKRVTAIV
jgi:hypothetical protein